MDRCQTDLMIAPATHYMVQESPQEVLDAMCGEWVFATVWTGSELMPPHQIVVRSSEIVAVRELTEPDWIWTKQMTEAHYRRQMQEMETSPTVGLATEFKRMVDLISGDAHE